MKEIEQKSGISRRNFIKGFGGGVAGTVAITSTLPDSADASTKGPHGSKVRGPNQVAVSLLINGQKKVIKVDPRITLLDAIRDQLDFTGTKRVCNRGACGACTVIMNGRTILACSTLAVDADGSTIQTIEGLSKGDKLHPVQESYIKYDALQCGFCTPGFIMSSIALLKNNPSPTMDDIKHGVAGNLCRCGTYPNVFKAIDSAAKNMKKGG
jgi:xanthine dehydrogenase YagT iron-sulfur-binding subunit